MDFSSHIELNRKQLNEIVSNYFWNFGGEGCIYRIPIEKNKHVLLKLFFNPKKNHFYLPEASIQNKQQKIELLRKQTLPNYIQIKSPVFFEHHFIGYFMNEAVHFQPLSYNTFSKLEQVIFLKKLRKQLIRFHQIGIIYGDLKSDNVLSHFRNYKLGCLCDLDNVKIDQIPIDIRSDYVEEFLQQYGKIDENLDWYVFNLLTLEIIYQLDQRTDIPFLETRSFIGQYKGKSLILRNMLNITDKYDGSLLLEDSNFYEEIKIPYVLK